jgi:hypothetical protein
MNRRGTPDEFAFIGHIIFGNSSDNFGIIGQSPFVIFVYVEPVPKLVDCALTFPA